MLESVEVLAVAGAEVVQHADLFRDLLVVLDDVGADEAGASGDEDFHKKGSDPKLWSSSRKTGFLPSKSCVLKS